MIYVVSNDNGDVMAAFMSAASAHSYLGDKLKDEKNNHISLILLDHDMMQEDKNREVAKLNKIYNEALNRLDTSYDFFRKENLDFFSVDEYTVKEVCLFE